MLWIALGDSVTEGATYALWISQSLKAAGQPPPHWFNRGVGGHTSVQMLARLERDVLRHRPDRVFFNAGLNDVLQGRSDAFFPAVTEILNQLRQAGISTCVITTTALAGKYASMNATLSAMNDHLRQLAQEYDFDVAEVFIPFLAAVEKGELVVSPDDIHLTLEGYRLMTAAILKVIDSAVPVAPSFDPPLEAGVPLDWELRALDTTQPVWKIHLPEISPSNDWWQSFEAARGYVLDLSRFDAQIKKFTATTKFAITEAGPVFLRIGGYVESIRIDGVPVAIPPTDTLWGIRELGWSQPLTPGSHIIEALIGHVFFVSCLPRSQCPLLLSF